MMNGAMAVITGGTAGIGRACAEGLLAAGAGGVLINGRDAARAERARAEIQARFPQARVAVALGDVAKPEVAEAVMAAAIKQLGRIDVLVNSTGGNDLPRLLFRTPPAEIPGILERCLFAQLLSCAAALPYMRAAGGGAVINIASDAGKIPTPGESVIGAAMAGIILFTRALAVEGKRDGIRANVLTPSITSGTEHYDKVMADPFSGKIFAKAEKMAALGVVDKDELAGLAVYLASPAAAKITGQAISMTGGISAL
jgi:2-hydroxycyclohexanecarboxyl-CoA dehydrogenase